MLHIHPNTRTTPVTRAKIARSDEPSSVLAGRYGVSTEIVPKWRKRGVADCLDRSARPHHLPWKASEEERAIVCAVLRSTNLALDDLAFVLCHFLPHLNRDSIWRILQSEGLNRRPKPLADRPVKARDRGRFATTTSASCTSTSSICRSSRPAMTSAVNAPFLSPSSADPAPCTSRLSFNGRVNSEVLAINVYSHRQLEQLLRGFNAAYNARRQRVLDGKTPD